VVQAVAHQLLGGEVRASGKRMTFGPVGWAACGAEDAAHPAAAIAAATRIAARWSAACIIVAALA
jgi:hypothetical protein